MATMLPARVKKQKDQPHVVKHGPSKDSDENHQPLPAGKNSATNVSILQRRDLAGISGFDALPIVRQDERNDE